jgi:hypothetical protein
MEYWNDGIVSFQRMVSILNFIVETNFAIYPILQYPKTHYSAKASLRAQYSAKASLRAQHSNIPIGAKPLTFIERFIDERGNSEKF